MKTTIIAVLGDSFNGTSTETGCCDVSVDGAVKMFLGRGEAGGWKFGFLYAYTTEDAASVEAELVSGGATIIGKVTGATNAFVDADLGITDALPCPCGGRAVIHPASNAASTSAIVCSRRPACARLATYSVRPLSAAVEDWNAGCRGERRGP